MTKEPKEPKRYTDMTESERIQHADEHAVTEMQEGRRMDASLVVKDTAKKDVGMSYRAIEFPDEYVKAIAVVSGGLDSTTMLYSMIKDMYWPIVLTFYYGQKHSLEVDYARATCDRLGLEHHVISMPTLPGSALTDKDIEVPKEDYSVESQKATVVPNRNMIFLSVAAAYAIAYDCEKIFYAAHWNDKAVYPDCTEEFVTKLNEVLQEANYEDIEVIAPFIHLAKDEIISAGVEYGVPFEDTWSCYDPVEVPIQESGGFVRTMVHCGVCGTCKERKQAFEIAGVHDPTAYQEVSVE